MFKFELFCPFHKLTGLYCPGCGVTRMFESLFKGDIYQAFRYNPLIFILLPFLMFYVIDIIISKIKKKESISNKIPNIVYYSLIVILLIYGVMRNIPMFDFLKPTVLN